jgi:hypothetical protein
MTLLLPGVGVASAETKKVVTKQESQAEMHAERWGLQVLGIRRSASDYMLDFRFRILDTEKAATLMDRGTEAYIVDEKTGRRFKVPVTKKLGPLRQSGLQTKPNRNYFMFFANPARILKRGDMVSVVIGDFKAEHIKIE